VWFRLTVDLATKRVLHEQMTTKAHFMNTRYYAFDEAITIATPRGRHGN